VLPWTSAQIYLLSANVERHQEKLMLEFGGKTSRSCFAAGS